ncbi:MAG: hypothetical protein M3Z05_14765, partial [Gemmatimonadota bacterium]|nr:hypothetical protein [Gemmatimonadota bacterium]
MTAVCGARAVCRGLETPASVSRRGAPRAPIVRMDEPTHDSVHDRTPRWLFPAIAWSERRN